MVATVGSISIDLSTNAGKFAAGMKASATTVEQTGSRMAKAMASIERSTGLAATALKSFGTGILAGAGLTSLTALIGRARDAIGELDDIADRAKSSGLGTDLLQSLEHGAKNAGIEVDALSGGLQFFAKGMGQAAEGTGRLYSGLLKLNPVLLQQILNAKDQEERLKLVADALDRTKDATQRAALSAALFGDVDLARLFEGGAAGVDKLVAAMDGKLFTAEQFARAGEYDTILNDLERDIKKAVDSMLLDLGPALVATGQLFLAGVTGVDNYIKRVNDLSLTLQAFASDPSGKALADFLLGPEGGGGIAGFFRDAVAATRDFQAEIAAVNREIAETEKGIDELKAAGVPLEDMQLPLENLRALNAQVDALQAKLAEQMTVNIDTTAASAAIAALGGALGALSQQALNAATGGPLPIVHGGGGGVGQDVMDDVERAVDRGTAATDQTSRAVLEGSRVANSLAERGYHDVVASITTLGSSIGYGRFNGVTSSGGGSGGGGSGSWFDSGGGSSSSGSWFDSGGSGGSGSWAGRRMTFGGGTPDPSNKLVASGSLDKDLYAARVAGTRMTADTSSITSGGAAPVNVTVVVKPILTGERLSTQSRAEIKQAAAEGANAALRAYNGR